MPNINRISALMESSSLLEDKIALLEKKPDSKKTETDNVQLKELWAQRSLFQSELVRLRAAQQTNLSAFFGGKV